MSENLSIENIVKFSILEGGEFKTPVLMFVFKDGSRYTKEMYEPENNNYINTMLSLKNKTLKLNQLKR
jgi:hypothetical protein